MNRSGQPRKSRTSRITGLRVIVPLLNEENNNNQSSLPSPLHHQGEHKKAFTNDFREGKAIPLQYANHLGHHHSFCKQLSCTNIGRPDHELGRDSGQFVFPSDFMRTHGEQVQASVKFQGIHEDSPIEVITFGGVTLKNRQRVHFLLNGADL